MYNDNVRVMVMQFTGNQQERELAFQCDLVGVCSFPLLRRDYDIFPTNVHVRPGFPQNSKDTTREVCSILNSLNSKDMTPEVVAP